MSGFYNTDTLTVLFKPQNVHYSFLSMLDNNWPLQNEEYVVINWEQEA